MNVDVPEGYAVIFLVGPSIRLLDGCILLVPLHEVAAEHDHARDPEKQNLVGSNQERGGIEDLQIPRFLWPSQRGEGQQSRGKPGVEHVGNLF